MPVAVENDANVAALAEWKLGAGRGAEDLVLLTLGTGVGGGVVIEGALFRGWAELGHVVVVADGPPCQGRCAAAVTSRPSRRAMPPIGRRRSSGAKGRTRELLVGRAEEGDAAALEALAGIGHLLGAAIGSFVNIFAPELTIVGGGFGDRSIRLSRSPPRSEVAVREALEPARAGPDRQGGARLRRGVDRRRSARVRGDRSGAVMPLAVCATPIGNLEDVTLRVLDELRGADVVLCEDTRHSKGLLDRHGIRPSCSATTSTTRLARTAELLPRLAGRRADRARLGCGPAGSERSGCPPDLGRARGGRARDGAAGSSAVETALVASGLVGERYQFLGYLPRGEKALGALWSELRTWAHPAVAFESPKRLPATLRSLAATLPERPVAVCRELTKRFEEVVRGSAAEVATASPSRRRVS